eukprot:TRINITY_DN67424_c0_g1_i1.p1 TRINITY_DN67424_c0_g1~~TRINITY_DN67424_c0_g1_i1.p1  ORF type:complete len:201 (-),score=49.56 TRINITY_DN67424_c0_g1_i1:107-709(-)
MATPRQIRAGLTPRGGVAQKRDEFCGEKVGNLLARLQQELRRAEHDVRREEEGKEDLRLHLQQLELEHRELKRALDRATAEFHEYDQGGRVFEERYKEHLDATHAAYNRVRGLHKEGIGILSDPNSFGYHQAFRRPADNFGGTYFTPRPLRRHEEKQSIASRKADKLAKSGQLGLPPAPASARGAKSGAGGGSGAGSGTG